MASRKAERGGVYHDLAWWKTTYVNPWPFWIWGLISHNKALTNGELSDKLGVHARGSCQGFTYGHLHSASFSH